jgi:hypothetical protein
MLSKLLGLMLALYVLVAGERPHAGKKEQWLINEVHFHYEQALAAAPTSPTMVSDRVIGA